MTPLLLLVLADISLAQPTWEHACRDRLRAAQASAVGYDRWFGGGKFEPLPMGFFEGSSKGFELKTDPENGNGFSVEIFATEYADEGWHDASVVYRWERTLIRARYHNGMGGWIEIFGEQPRARVRLFKRIFQAAVDDCLRLTPLRRR